MPSTGGPTPTRLAIERGFINQAYDILQVLGGHEPTVPIPDFHDADQTQRVLEAALVSAAEHGGPWRSVR